MLSTTTFSEEKEKMDLDSGPGDRESLQEVEAKDSSWNIQKSDEAIV